MASIWSHLRIWFDALRPSPSQHFCQLYQDGYSLVEPVLSSD